MDDLVAFLRARIDEDERAAREALAKTTTSRRMINGTMVTVPIVPREWRPSAWPAERVLREVDAKRRIVDLHEGEHECQDIRTGVYPPDAHLMGKTPGESWTHYTTEYFGSGPCATLKVLSLPYADHPDYQEEWRP